MRSPGRSSASGTEELQADLFAGGGGETIREARELAARPPDRALRDSAEALVRKIDGLFDQVIALRNEIRELTVPEPEADRPRFSFGLPRRDSSAGGGGRESGSLGGRAKGREVAGDPGGTGRGDDRGGRQWHEARSGRERAARCCRWSQLGGQRWDASKKKRRRERERSARGHRERAGGKAEPGSRESTGSRTGSGA